MTNSRSTAASTIGAACGGVFALLLMVAVGDGSHSYSPQRTVTALVALTLAIPFVVNVRGVLRAGTQTDPWFADTAMAAGIAGIALKLSSSGPELAIPRAHIADNTTLHRANFNRQSNRLEAI